MENKYVNLKSVLGEYLDTPRKNGIPSKIISDPDKSHQEKIYTIQKTTSDNKRLFNSTLQGDPKAKSIILDFIFGNIPEFKGKVTRENWKNYKDLKILFGMTNDRYGKGNSWQIKITTKFKYPLEYVEPDLPPKYEEIGLPHQQVPQGIVQNESETSIQLRNETIERDFKEIDELYKKLIQKLNIIDSELQSDSLNFTKDIEQIKGRISLIEKESNGLKENIIGTIDSLSDTYSDIIPKAPIDDLL